jgi:hypothetical protein
VVQARAGTVAVSGCRVAGIRRRPTLAAVGVEAGLPQLDEVTGDVRVGDEGVLEVVLRVRGARLAQVLRDRAQDDDLTPGELRGEDEPVEAVGLGAAVPDRGDRALEEVTQLVVRALLPDRGVGNAQAEVVDVQARSVGAGDLERVLVDDLDAHVGEDRQHVGQREGVDPEELEAPDGVGRLRRPVEGDARAGARAEPVEVGEVGHALAHREGLLVGGRERATEAVEQPVALLLAVLGAQGVTEAVGPRAADLDEALLEQVLLGAVEPTDPLATLDAHDELQPRQGRLADARGELDGLPAEGVLEQVGHLHANGRVVAVARDVDQAGDEAAEVVLADEQLGAAPLLQLGDGHRRLVELLDAGLDQLVARVALEDTEEVLAGVAVVGHAGAVEHALNLLGDQRHPQHRLGVGRGGVEAEEAALADHGAVVGVGLDPDVVEVGHAVHGGARVGLGQHEDVGLVGLGRRLGAQDLRCLAQRRVGAQQAQARTGHGFDDLAGLGLAQGVVAVTQEGEVVVGHPAQEPDRELGLVGVDALGRGALELGGDDEGLGAHLRPVLDGLANVLEDVAHGALELGPSPLVALAVDGEQHPRLGDLADSTLGDLAGGVSVQHRLEAADGVAAHDELRVDDEVDVDARADEGAGDGIDQEGHVVGDDLDDGSGVGPAVDLGRRVVDPHVRHAGMPVARQGEVAGRRAGIDVGGCAT